MSLSVFVGERPVKRSDVETAAGLGHQIEPGLEDGGVSGAGIKLQPFRDALHQDNPDRGEDTKRSDDDDDDKHLCSSFCLRRPMNQPDPYVG